jgi:hypothetical protein
MEIKNYGLPTKFKFVSSFDGVQSIHQDLPYGFFHNWNTGVGELAGKILPDGHRWLPMQQTHFTDSDSQDVFFGDVFAIELQPGKVSFFIVRWVTYRILGVCAFGKIDRASGRVTPHMIHMAHISNYYIVGNAHEPSAKWLERARAIWPDAQLLEGVRG